MAAAKTQTATERLAAAKIAENAAYEALTALRERQKTSGDVTAGQFGTAGHAVETAVLEREGAEEALAEERRQERLSRLAAIRADIESHSAPEGAAGAFTAAVDAVAALLEIAGPSSGQQVAAWARQLAAEGVKPLDHNELPGPEDGGLGWRQTITGVRVVYAGDRATVGYDGHVVLEGVIAGACSKAGMAPRISGVTIQAPKGLLEDPGRWFGGIQRW